MTNVTADSVTLCRVDRIAACKATVIGVGAIGRQVALQLTAMGIPWLQLVDYDRVETSPISPAKDTWKRTLAKLKVDATMELCKKINGGIEIVSVPERFRRSMDVGNVIFCCVDSIDVRRLIWEAVGHQVSCLCDGRMSAEVLRVLTAACDAESRGHYPTTVFRTEEAFVGPCTAKTTIYCANIAAGSDGRTIHEVPEAASQWRLTFN